MSTNSVKLTEEQVRHVAKLGRLRLSDDEVAQMAVKLSAVLGYVSTLSEINVEGIEPMAHPIDVSNAFRDDVPVAGLPVQTVLANAPDQSPPFFKVPKVLIDEGGALIRLT